LREECLLTLQYRTLKHVAQYSPLLNETTKREIANTPTHVAVKEKFAPQQLPLSELPQLLNKEFTLNVPVYTVWGACEDVRVLEKFRSGEYKVDKLHIVDEVNSRLLDVGGVKLRLLGLGGAVVIHKLFDNGEGKTYIAGGQGTMWTTLLQIGSLIDTANRVYDPSETRIFLTHASPARDGILNQLSVTLKADFSISAGLHFRYGSSYNEFSVNPSLDHYRGKLAASKASFNDVWETVRMDVEQAISSNENHKTLLQSALEIVEKMPTVANGGNPFGGPVGGGSAGGQVDESAFKNMWNFNLADAAFGYLVLEIEGGRIGTEMRAQGFNFAHRGGKPNIIPQISQQPTPMSQPLAASNVPPSAPTGPAQTRNGPPFAAPVTPFPTQQQQQPPASQQMAARTQSQPKAVSSPAPPVTQTQAKPLTPAPATNVSVPTGSPAAKITGHATNGTSDKAEAKPSSSLYITFTDSEQQARELFPTDDQAKIKKVSRIPSKFSQNNFKMDFESHELADEMMKKALEGIQKSDVSVPGKNNKKPKVAFFHEKPGTPFREHQHRESQSLGGAGTWQGSNRGAATGASNQTSRGGYQSGASDSEGGRGRGGFRGGRGRGDRGDRGDRGGRGGRGGASRGSFQSKTGTDGAADTKPATPAVSGDKAADS
jgi:anti-sigma28 factor (negative regulator of flagellin synthesis)